MNIAFFCIPAHGHTNPTLAVVRELTARGHTVRYYTTEAFRAKVEAAGAVFVPFDAEAARPGMTAADGARLGSDLAFSTRLIVDLTLAADDWLSRELTVHRPDVIVGDSMAFWAKLMPSAKLLFWLIMAATSSVELTLPPVMASKCPLLKVRYCSIRASALLMMPMMQMA